VTRPSSSTVVISRCARATRPFEPSLSFSDLHAEQRGGEKEEPEHEDHGRERRERARADRADLAQRRPAAREPAGARGAEKPAHAHDAQRGERARPARAVICLEVSRVVGAGVRRAAAIVVGAAAAALRGHLCKHELDHLRGVKTEQARDARWSGVTASSTKQKSQSETEHDHGASLKQKTSSRRSSNGMRLGGGALFFGAASVD
jgi:hypothetical protein